MSPVRLLNCVLKPFFITFSLIDPETGTIKESRNEAHE